MPGPTPHTPGDSHDDILSSDFEESILHDILNATEHENEGDTETIKRDRELADRDLREYQKEEEASRKHIEDNEKHIEELFDELYKGLKVEFVVVAIDAAHNIALNKDKLEWEQIILSERGADLGRTTEKSSDPRKIIVNLPMEAFGGRVQFTFKDRFVLAKGVKTTGKYDPVSPPMQNVVFMLPKVPGTPMEYDVIAINAVATPPPGDDSLDDEKKKEAELKKRMEAAGMDASLAWHNEKSAEVFQGIVKFVDARIPEYTTDPALAKLKASMELLKLCIDAYLHDKDPEKIKRIASIPNSQGWEAFETVYNAAVEWHNKHPAGAP